MRKISLVATEKQVNVSSREGGGGGVGELNFQKCFTKDGKY